MKEITYDEYINNLFEILKYIDDICKKNDIKYTLIGGSLIGAIRHSDIIPWDDDIDIALTHDNYEKLKKVMINNKNSRYKYIDNSIEKTYYYPFAKIIDSYTSAIEGDNRNINNYGMYIDVFELNNAPDNDAVRKKHYKKIVSLKKIFGVFAETDERLKDKKSIIKRARNYFIFKIGFSYFCKKYIKLSRKYNCKNTNYLLSNWPAYGYEHEIILSKYYINYMRKKFRNINAMVVSNYDEVLTTIFGDYMELPPEEKRVSHHNIKAYWKDKKNEEK